MSELQLVKDPLKLYIQDIYRATLVPGQKYIYEIFGMQFKNIHIQGVVTEMYFTNGCTSTFEVSDPTGTISVLYHSKFARNIATNTVTELSSKVARHPEDSAKKAMEFLKQSILKKVALPFDYTLGSHVSVVGDVYVDDIKDVRTLSAFEVHVCSQESDVVWLEELYYLYEKFYLWERN